MALIDMHTHGVGGHDTRTGKAGDILAIARLHGLAGTGAFLPTVYAGPIERMRADMAAIAEAMSTKPLRGAARILGVYLEGPFLNPSRAGAQGREGLLAPSVREFNDLVRGYEDIVRVICVAPELKGATRVIERACSLGMRVSMGHSEATYSEAMRGVRAGATCVTHIFNAMRPLHHREPGLAGAALTVDSLYVEAIADGVHLSPAVLKLIFRTKPADRIMLVSDSVKGPGRARGVLQGGKASVRDAWDVLKPLGITRRAFGMATSANQKRFLGMT